MSVSEYIFYQFTVFAVLHDSASHIYSLFHCLPPFCGIKTGLAGDDQVDSEPMIVCEEVGGKEVHRG